MGRKLTPEETRALALLAKGGRVIVILIPDGIPMAVIAQLHVDINETLDTLAKHYAVKALDN